MSEKTNKEKMVSLVNELETKIETAQSYAIQKAQEINQEISKAKLSLAEAEERKEQAQISQDLEAFKTASHDIVDSKATIEFYTNMKASNDSGSLISESEYDEIVKNMKDGFAELQKKDAKALVPLLESVQAIGQEEEAILKRINDLLYTLTYDVMRREKKDIYCPKVIDSIPNMIFSNHLKRDFNHTSFSAAFETIKSAAADDN